MKKIIHLSLAVILVALFLAACKKNAAEMEELGRIEKEDIPADDKTAETEDQMTSDVQKSGTEELEEAVNEPADTVSPELTFEDLSKLSFEFCSGAGGWSTNFNIEKDGFFKGTFHDSELGATGVGFEDGTIYSSTFKGHFKNLIKISEYCYEMTLDDIVYSEKIGEEECMDGIKYIYTDAYGLTGTETFTVYVKGTPLKEIPKAIYEPWLSVGNESDTELTRLVIINEAEEEGIYSYERMSAKEEADMNYSTYLSSYNYWREKCTETGTQFDMNMCASQQFTVADDCLNALWDLIKYNTDEKTFQTLLEEQRSWNKEKEAKAKAAADACEGDSVAPAEYYTVMAEETMSRCEVLMTYIK